MPNRGYVTQDLYLETAALLDKLSILEQQQQGLPKPRPKIQILHDAVQDRYDAYTAQTKEGA